MPWTKYKKTPKDYIIDVLVEMGRFYEDIDAIKHCDDADQHSTSFDGLKTEMLSRADSILAWQPLFSGHIGSEEVDSKANSAIDVEAIAYAYARALYSTVIIILCDAYRNQLKAGDALELLLDPGQACKDIVQVLPVFLSSCTRGFRQHLFPLPVSAAALHLSVTASDCHQDERVRLRKILSQPDVSPMRKFVESLQPHIFADLWNRATN